MDFFLLVFQRGDREAFSHHFVTALILLKSGDFFRTIEVGFFLKKRGIPFLILLLSSLPLNLRQNLVISTDFFLEMR